MGNSIASVNQGRLVYDSINNDRGINTHCRFAHIMRAILACFLPISRSIAVTFNEGTKNVKVVYVNKKSFVKWYANNKDWAAENGAEDCKKFDKKTIRTLIKGVCKELKNKVDDSAVDPIQPPNNDPVKDKIAPPINIEDQAELKIEIPIDNPCHTAWNKTEELKNKITDIEIKHLPDRHDFQYDQSKLRDTFKSDFDNYFERGVIQVNQGKITEAKLIEELDDLFSSLQLYLEVVNPVKSAYDPIGLTNFKGNNCYLNAGLQMITHSGYFDYFMKRPILELDLAEIKPFEEINNAIDPGEFTEIEPEKPDSSGSFFPQIFIQSKALKDVIFNTDRTFFQKYCNQKSKHIKVHKLLGDVKKMRVSLRDIAHLKSKLSKIELDDEQKTAVKILFPKLEEYLTESIELKTIEGKYEYDIQLYNKNRADHTKKKEQFKKAEMEFNLASQDNRRAINDRVSLIQKRKDNIAFQASLVRVIGKIRNGTKPSKDEIKAVGDIDQFGDTSRFLLEVSEKLGLPFKMQTRNVANDLDKPENWARNAVAIGTGHHLWARVNTKKGWKEINDFFVSPLQPTIEQAGIELLSFEYEG